MTKLQLKARESEKITVVLAHKNEWFTTKGNFPGALIWTDSVWFRVRIENSVTSLLWDRPPEK